MPRDLSRQRYWRHASILLSTLLQAAAGQNRQFDGRVLRLGALLPLDAPSWPSGYTMAGKSVWIVGA